MTRGFFRRENEIERLLRGARPHASDDLADRLADLAEATSGSARTPGRLAGRLAGHLAGRIAVAGGLTAAMVAGLAATGGMSYAASTVDHVVAQVTHRSTFMGARMAVAVKRSSAAADQYTTATGTTSQQSVGAGLHAVSQTLASLPPLLPGASVAIPGFSGSTTPVTSDGKTTQTTLSATATRDATTGTTVISLTATTKTTTGTGASAQTTETATTVSMPEQTFKHLFDTAGAASVVVDPSPQVNTIGSQPVVGVTLQFNDANNNPVTVTNLPDPIAVSIPKPAGGFDASYVPAFSTDGTTFTAVKLIPGGGRTLPGTQTNGVYDWQTGYYVDDNGNIVILTRHTTIFAAISRVNLGVSESGRKLKKAGSGLFGDALLVHPGPAALKQVGGKVAVYPFKTLKGDAVKFSFFVDEQVSAYVQLFKGSKKIPLQLHGTQIRGGTIRKGGTIKTLHVAVLRPGTLPIRLRVPASQLKTGAKYRIRVAVVDFDGNKTVRFIPFTG